MGGQPTFSQAPERLIRSTPRGILTQFRRLGEPLGTVLQGAIIVELEPPLVEQAALRVENGIIVARGSQVAPQPGDEVLDLSGRLVMPGMVCAHHHLYATFARGLTAAESARATYEQIVAQGWWRLDQALDLDAVQAAASIGGLEALASGTTTIVDHHASPRCIQGSLLRVARGLNEVGARGVLSYEVSDRHGAVAREEAIEENVAFIRKARGRFRGLVGAHASFTISKDGLDGLSAAVKETGAGLHIHIAEDPCDEKLSFERFGEVPVARLLAAGLLDAKSVVAQAVHLSWPELSQLLTTGAWIVHNPRSNMNQMVGYAPAGKFGMRATLGTDGIRADMFAEAQVAYLRAKEAGQPIDVLHYLANGHRLASQVFGVPFGVIKEGAVADLLVLDYRSATPVTAETLRWHVLNGLGAHCIEAVMVDGVWRRWGRRSVNADIDALYRQAQETAQGVWARYQQAAPSPAPAASTPAPVPAAAPAAAPVVTTGEAAAVASAPQTDVATPAASEAQPGFIIPPPQAQTAVAATQAPRAGPAPAEIPLGTPASKPTVAGEIPLTTPASPQVPATTAAPVAAPVEIPLSSPPPAPRGPTAASEGRAPVRAPNEIPLAAPGTPPLQRTPTATGIPVLTPANPSTRPQPPAGAIPVLTPANSAAARPQPPAGAIPVLTPANAAASPPAPNKAAELGASPGKTETPGAAGPGGDAPPTGNTP